MIVRPLTDTDEPALLELQHATAGADPRWSPGALRQRFCDPAHRGGASAIVIERGQEVVGAAGWVVAGAEFYGAPVLAADADAAAWLVEDLVRRARAAGAGGSGSPVATASRTRRRRCAPADSWWRSSS